MTRPWLILCEALGLTLFIFGLLVWGYIVLINVTHPEWMWQAFSHHSFPPFDWRADDIGIVSFVVALVGFLMWYLSRACSSSPDRSRKK